MKKNLKSLCRSLLKDFRNKLNQTVLTWANQCNTYSSLLPLVKCIRLNLKTLILGSIHVPSHNTLQVAQRLVKAHVQENDSIVAMS